MSQFADNTWFEVIVPGCCNSPFAMNRSLYNQRKEDKKTWWCPSCGTSRVFIGKTEEQKLKERLEQEQRTSGRLREEKDAVSRNYTRMRKRVANGICPCCNRTFQNLLRHMKTEHPDFGDNKVLKTLRLMFGLSQDALAKEIGTSATQISNYENKRSVSGYAKRSIDGWVTGHSA